MRAGQRVQVGIHRDTASTDTVVVHHTHADGGAWLTTHPRAAVKGSWVIDPDHWAGLPDGHTRATTTDTPETSGPAAAQSLAGQPEPLACLLHRHGADITVAARPLSIYDQLAGLATT